VFETRRHNGQNPLFSESRVKQIAQYQDGRLELQDVPAPVPPPGGILARVTHSVISVGTEKMKVEQARMNLLQKARARPDQVRKVLDTARNLGWRSAWEKVRNRLETPTPLGYSAAGVVAAVDAGHSRFRVGDRVACGGAECAFHAEYIAVPDLLTARVPEGVANWQAAYTTVAAIALQAVRQADPGLGDRVAVLGQGLIGLLVTNLLAVHGARVMAVDLLEGRRALCLTLGAERMVVAGAQNLTDEAREWSAGLGVDIAVICTAGDSNLPVEQAAEILRDRGRMVVVGNTRADLAWKVFYGKELEVRYSRSYGPGRYDPAYEWGGADYPPGYVRWTEQRNFDACLRLMATGQLKLAEITTRRAPFASAPAVYQQLLAGDSADIGVVLEYGEGGDLPAGQATVLADAVPGDQRAGAIRLAKPASHVDVIGAGNFARTMLLPHLRGRLPFGAVVNQTALSANHVKSKFGFASAGTDYQQILAEKAEGAVLIATRHHLHAPLVRAALSAHRQVFVEKPLCLSRSELEEIDASVASSKGTVQVGFNRRFAPATAALKAALAACPGPKTCVFKVNAGRLDPDHWYANVAESGGRVVGEVCHFLDFFCHLLGRPRRIFAQSLRPAEGRLPFPDSVAAQVEFADGSCGQLVYSGEGDPRYPKESLTVFASGLVAEIVNFQSLTVWQGRREKKWTYASKGHAEQMAAWAAFLRAESPHPLPYTEARQSMRLTFALVASLQQSSPVELTG